MKVSVKDFSSNRVLDLNTYQLDVFKTELESVKRYLPSAKGPLSGVVPDCTITVTEGKRVTEYEIYGRALLMNKKSRKMWQFYFGVLLLEWLHP